MNTQDSMVLTIADTEAEFQVQYLMVDGEPWYRGKAVAKLLGYSDTSRAVKDHVRDQHKKKLEELVNLSDKRLGFHERTSFYISREGLKSIVTKSNKPEAIHVAKQLGIQLDTKYLRKEIEIVSFFQQFLTSLNIPFEFQKTLGPYRIDLYLPVHLIAVEIDEFGHKDRNAIREKTREDFIRCKLRCKFMRINPDASNFSIAVCLADLTRMLYQGDRSSSRAV